MKKLHVASFSEHSGISKYASDFFDLVLRYRGYERLDYGQLRFEGEKAIGPEDLVHIEIGINEKAEIELLYRLINRGHRNIHVTLHDPPFIQWPHFRFQNPLLNSMSKFIHLYLRNFWIGESVFHKIRRFFVLTRRGCKIMRDRYGLENVFFLPFIINESKIKNISTFNQNMLVVGFIGKNKGLHYALSLHEALLVDYPESRFIVIGDGADNKAGSDYLKQVKNRYNRNVDYLGFVEDSKLIEVFDKASIAVFPFSAYRAVTPASASVLGAMSMGKVVCATNVNAVSEFIHDSETGYLLTGKLDRDISLLNCIMSSPKQLYAVGKYSVEYLRKNHSSEVVCEAFDRVDSGFL